MIVKSMVRKNEYRDSIQLMRISGQIREIQGVEDAAVLMATDTNKKILEDAELLADEIKSAGPNDLVITVRAVDEKAAEKAIAKVNELLK